MRHFGIYANSGDVQTALNEETLVNPYVALVSGTLDYDTAEPEDPCYLGEWSDDGEGNYIFHVLDTGDTAWTNGVNIGTLLGVYFEGAQVDMNVKLTCMGGMFKLELSAEGGSETPSYEFYEGRTEFWEFQVVAADPDSSDATLKVNWDGRYSFVFSTLSADHPLSMSTINPECSE